MSLLQSRLDFSGSTIFKDNSARIGGALTLEDHSIVYTSLNTAKSMLSHPHHFVSIQIQLLRGSRVSFIRNYAAMQGGAISIRSPTVGLDTDIIRLFNTRCFIQYEFSNVPASLDPAEWDVGQITYYYLCLLEYLHQLMFLPHYFRRL